jgi:predicted phosphoadenosine phosphosulfate sulfurtransferase
MKTKRLKKRLTVLRQQEIVLQDTVQRWASVYRILESLINTTPLKGKEHTEHAMKNIREVYEREEIHELVKVQKEIADINNQVASHKSLCQSLIKLITKQKKPKEEKL